MKRVAGFILLVLLTTVNAYLIANPNLLGKLGFIIFKYSFLRTFPRAWITVAVVVATVLLITEAVVWLNARHVLSRKVVVSVLIGMVLLFVFVLIKTAIDFQGWSYSHAGNKLRYGAYLLPIILISITSVGLLKVLKQKPRFPESPLNEKIA